MGLILTGNDLFQFLHLENVLSRIYTFRTEYHIIILTGISFHTYMKKYLNKIS